MAPRVTVADLRKEARTRLKECSSGKTISRMNRTELLQFLGCVGMELDGVTTYQAQEEQRAADRAVAVPQGFFPREPRGYFAQQQRKPIQVDDDITITRRRKKKGMSKAQIAAAQAGNVSGSGHCMNGRGMGTYRDFVRVMLPKMRAKGMTSQEAMKAVGAAWRKHKGQRGSGLVPAGQRGMGLVQAGEQEGEGFMDELSKWSGRAATGAAIAGAVQPELAPVLEPAAAAAKGISYISGLFK